MNGVEMMLKTVLKAMGVDPVAIMAQVRESYERFQAIAAKAEQRLNTIEDQNAEIIRILKGRSDNANSDHGGGRNDTGPGQGTDGDADNVRQLGKPVVQPIHAGGPR